MDPSSVSDFFFNNGILGVIVLVLGGVVVWQQKRLDARDQKYDVLQDKRTSDSEAHTASYIATTREMVGTQKDTLNAINFLQKSIEGLSKGNI